MGKPIASLATSLRDDAPTISKYLPQEIIDGDFHGFVKYMSDPEKDETNPALESDEEKRVAGRVRGWMQDLSDRPEAGSVNLVYLNERNEPSEPLDLEAHVADHIGVMTRRKTTVTDNGPQEYDAIDLAMEYNPVGGK